MSIFPLSRNTNSSNELRGRACVETLNDRQDIQMVNRISTECRAWSEMHQMRRTVQFSITQPPVSLNRCCATKLLFRQIYLLVFTCVPEGAGILGEDAPGQSFYRNKVHQTQKATSEDVALIALAGSTGLEPATSDVTGRRSNQTELTPQADVRVCFRSRALRGLVYTEVCPARNNFFEKIFGTIREGLRGWGAG